MSCNSPDIIKACFHFRDTQCSHIKNAYKIIRNEGFGTKGEQVIMSPQKKKIIALHLLYCGPPTQVIALERQGSVYVLALTTTL